MLNKFYAVAELYDEKEGWKNVFLAEGMTRIETEELAQEKAGELNARNVQVYQYLNARSENRSRIDKPEWKTRRGKK